MKLMEARKRSMKPMEAWKVISDNMSELYQRRIADGVPHGYSEDDTTAALIAFMALKKMEGGEDGVPACL